MIICCITAGANVLLNFLMIPKWGACGAAFTTAISSFLIMIMLVIKKDKHIKLDYLKDVMLSPCIGAVAIAVYCKMVSLFISNIWGKTCVCIFGSVLIYGVVTTILRNEICIQFLEIIKARLKK